MIRAAMKRGSGDGVSEIEADLMSGDALAWIAWDGSEILACVVTILQGSGESKFCNILACGGKHKNRWLGLLDDIERFAKSEGCKSMKFSGRKGWARVLDGYKVARVVLEKRLA